jgi:hypothetical protein
MIWFQVSIVSPTFGASAQLCTEHPNWSNDTEATSKNELYNEATTLIVSEEKLKYIIVLEWRQ